MFVGGAAAIGMFFVGPIALAIFGQPGDSGIAFFITKLYLLWLVPFGWKGCLAFEISRWIGRKGESSAAPPYAFQWKQDSLIAASLVALFVGGPLARTAYLNRPTAPKACGQERISCIATLSTTVHRMVGLQTGAPVTLTSNVNSIRMQDRAGGKLRWEAVEGVANSLEQSGYTPIDDSALPVKVAVQANTSGDAVVLDVRVSEDGAETARMIATFPGARLEKDSHGNRNLLAPLPPRSDGTIKGIWRDKTGDDQTLDQLYVFFQQSIGTVVENRESRHRILSKPIVAKHVDGDGSSRNMPTSNAVDDKCGSLVRKVESKDAKSDREADRGSELMEVRFAGSTMEPPHTYAHRTNRLSV